MQEQKLQTRKRKALREGNKMLLASTAIDLAELYFNEGHYEEAIEEYIVVADVYKQMGKHLDYARANRMIGEAYTHLREYDKALQYQNVHLSVAKKENDKLEEQRALATIGHTHLTSYLDIIDNPDKTPLKLAYKSFMKSLVVCESLTDISKQEHKDMTARLLANLGVVEESQGNYDKGIELVQRSINICKSYDLFEQLERGYTFLAALYSRKGEYNKAISQYNFAIEVAGRLKNKISLTCASLSAKADILIKLADFHGAKTVLLKAYKLKNPVISERETIERNLKIVAAMCYTEDSLLTVSDSDYKTKKRLYEKLGDGACSLKNYSNAIQYYLKMLEAAKSNGESGVELSPCYNSLAETYADNKQFDMAIKYHQKDYNISSPNTKDSVGSLLNLADCMEGAGKSLVDIENVYDQARSESIICGEKQLEAKVLSRHITLLRKNGRSSQVKHLQDELDKMDFVASESESEPPEEQATPDIGNDVSINEITDVSDESDAENDTSKPRAARKRTKGLVIKRNNKGETQLHTACINGNALLVRRLLDQGHTVNVRDNCGWLPIHEACITGHIEIVEMLIEKGASINDRGGTLCNGMTPLHDAASNGHLEVMQLLLDKGASAIAKNDIGEMPLHILKKWHTLNLLTPTTESLYYNLVEQLTQAIEKSGHSRDLVLQEENNTALVVDEDEPTARRHRTNEGTQTRKSAEQKNEHKIGSLRRNISLDDDLVPSTSKTSQDTQISEDSESNSSDYAITSDYTANATDEYKRVMKSVRHPLREENVEKKRKSNETHRRSAYFDADEVGDDWLEDDLATNQYKKRKTITLDPLVNTLGIRRRSSGSLRPHSSSSLKTNEEMEIPDDFLNSDFEIQTDNQNFPTISVADSDEKFKRSSVSKKRKSQSSLISQGFTRHRSFSPTNLKNNSNVVSQKRKQQTKLSSFGHTRNTIEADLPSIRVDGDNKTGNYNVNQVFNSEPIWSVDVRINGKLYRVPVPASETHSKTIKWLADEAAKRYSRKECMKPTLELETKNGAILAEDDYLSILFSTGTAQAEEVEARILNWNLPPLSDRYNEACVSSNTEPDEDLSKILREASTSLNISDMCLQNKYIAPLCKAINRQTNLHQLNLSGNVMLNDSIQLLCTSLPSLVNLTILSLSLNQLSADSLAIFAEMFTQSTKSILENLVSLDLSYNPLGDESLKYLAIITRYLRLQTLNLISVDVTSEIFNIISNRNVDLCLDYVVNLNISYNLLGKQQIGKVLSWLKPQKVENLNISSNITEEDGLVKDVVNWLETRGNEKLNLKSLDLSRCLATDTEIFELLRVLLFAEQFTSLNLSYNTNLTALSLRRLLQHHQSFVNLDLTGCENILRYFEDCTESTWSSLKCKQIRLSIDCSINGKEKDVLINVWRDKHKEKAKIIEELKGFLELSICD